MTNQPVQDIHALIAAGTVKPVEEMLGADKKEELAAAGTPFVVNDIKTGDDPAFGPFWEIHAEVDGAPVSFRMSYNDRRDPFIESIAAIVTNGPVGGLRLAAYPAKGGNDYISLEPA